MVSPDKIFDYSTCNAGLSRSTQRRLRLLRAVLPVFTDGAAKKYTLAKKFSSEREFWTRVLSPCLLMSMAEWPFERVNEDHGSLIKALLENLEKMMVLEKPYIADELSSSTFPRLEMLRKLLDGKADNVDDFLLYMLPETEVLTIPSVEHTCEELVKHLAEFARILKDTSYQPQPEESNVTQRKNRPQIGPILLTALSTISRYWGCTSPHPHQTAILLFTHRTHQDKEDVDISFTMLFNQRRGCMRWQESTITVNSPVVKPPILLILPENSSPTSQGKHRRSITRLCPVVSNKERIRLNFQIEDESLIRLPETEPKMEELENGDAISLADSLLQNDTELDFKGKSCLAVIISYSLLDYCQEPWFIGGLTRSTVHLIQQGPHLFLRPFLITDMSQKRRNSLQKSKLSIDVNPLYLAILLMEIFCQEPLVIKLDVSTDAEIAALRQAARSHFDRMDWDVHEYYQQAVATCLDISNSKEPEDFNKPYEFTQSFYEGIISPLESEFLSLWGDKDPDDVISTMKLPSVPQKATHKTIPHRYMKNLHTETAPQVVTTSKSMVSLFGRLTASSSKRLQPRFYDATDEPDSKEVQLALTWFDEFDQEHNKQKLPRPAKTRAEKIKIAVLDTGIDLSNPWISTKAGRIQCWPNSVSCKDTDGHGTHVAYLLLRLAPHAQLRISRISKSTLLRDADIKGIAEAIMHYSIGNDKVDIINLSFGFPRFHEKLRPILSAIRSARDNNVIIFAAAGNEGGNSGVSWPASLHETGDVIRINSSDGNGNASGFNTEDDSGRKICTLGEGVPSCQLDPKKEIIYRSGTSFATPIAAAIAAIVLGNMDNCLSLADLSNLPEDAIKVAHRLRSRLGMERVLCEICVLQSSRKRAGLSYITPWYFLEIDERSRAHIILNVLRDLPE